MSSLQQQLASLASKATQVTTLRNASILFDESEIQRISTQTVFSIGLNGFYELVRLNEHFAPYEKTLFSKSSVQFNRQLQTKAENKKLDLAISNFLVLLSPYILLKPAQKAFEYLLRRYHVQVFNVDAVMACALPFHASHVFTRILRTLELDNTRWEFLRDAQKQSEEGIGRSILVQSCIRDKGLITFIAEMCKKAVETTEKFSSCLVFYTVMCLEIIETVPTLQEKLVATLLPHLIDGVQCVSKSSYQTASYMIISQLASKTAFSPVLIETLLVNVIKHSRAVPVDSLTLIIHICQTQEINNFPESFMSLLINVEDLIKILNELSDRYDCSTFISSVVHFLLDNLHEPQYFQVLERIACEYSQISVLVPQIAAVSLSSYLSSKKDREVLLKFIHFVEIRFPLEFDEVLSQKFEKLKKCSKKDKTASKQLELLSSLNVANARHQPIADSGTTLFFALKHINASVRYQALITLIKKYKNASSGDTTSEEYQSLREFYVDSLIDLSHDDDASVLTEVLSAPDLVDLCAAKQLFSCLTNLFDQHETEQPKNAAMAIEILCESFYKKHETQRTEILQFLLTRLPWKESRDGELQKQIFRSSEIFCNILFSGFKSFAEKFNFSGDQRARIKCNEWLITSFVSNLSDSIELFKEVAEYVNNQEKPDPFLQFILVQVLGNLPKDEPLAFDISFRLSEWLRRYYMVHSDMVEEPADLKTVVKAITKDSPSLDANFASFSLLALIHNIPRDDNTSFKMEKLLEPPISNGTSITSRILFSLVNMPSPASVATYFKALLAVHPGFQLLRFLTFHSMEYHSKAGYGIKVRVRCLNFINVLLFSFAEYDPSIYEHIVPSLLIHLIIQETDVRHAALSCFNTLKVILKSPGKLKFQAPFYSGTADKDLSTIPISVLTEIIHNIMENSKVILTDANIVKKRFASFLESSKHSNAILQYLLSHIQAADHPAIPNGLLQIISEFPSPLKIQKTQNLLENFASDEKIKNFKTSRNMKIIPHYKELMESLVELFSPQVNDNSVLNNDVVITNIQNSLQTTQAFKSAVPLCLVMLKQISQEFFDCLNAGNQEKVFVALCHTLGSSHLHSRDGAKQVVQNLVIPSELIAKLLAAAVPASSDRSPSKKKAKRTLEVNDNEEDNSRRLEEVTLLLELLQVKKNFVSPHLLLPHLFELLKNLSATGNPLNGQLGSDYTMQLVLSSLRNVTNLFANSSTNKEQLKNLEPMFDVASVINCIRSSHSPQTHNKAFLLLASITRIFPNRVLKHAMSLFTFMGDTSLRSDDNYTFQVLHKTIQSIIPRIAAEKRSEQIMPIINVIVDSFHHIPSHRRLILFGSFVKSFGVEYFHVVLIFLFQLYSNKNNNAIVSELQYDTEDSIPSFCFYLVLQFSPLQVLPALTKIIQSLTAWKSKKSKDSSVLKQIIDSNASSGAIFDYYNISSITCQFIGKYLQSKSFFKQLRVLPPKSDSILQQSFITLFESIMFQLRLLSTLQFKVETNESTKCKVIIEQIYSMIELLNDLLHIDAFVIFISDLIHHYDPQVRRRSLLLLNEKIEEYEGDFDNSEISKFLELVKKISIVIMKPISDTMITDDNEETGESSVNQQTALYSLEILSRHFGTEAPETFLEILPCVIECLESSDDQVKASAIICIATNCISLGANILSHLPKFFPKILMLLRNSLVFSVDGQEENQLLITMSSLSMIEVALRNIPSFLSPYLKDMLGLLFTGSLLSHKSVQVTNKLTTLWQLVSEKIKTRKSLTALMNVYQIMESSDEYSHTSFKNFFDVFGSVCKQMVNSKVSVHYPGLVKFFVCAFDLRITLQSKFTYKRILAIEENMISAFSSFVLKLNEILFKPLFLKLRDWSVIDLQPFAANRKAFFYKLVDRLSTKLNVVLVPMFAYLLDDMISLLRNPMDILQSPEGEVHEFHQDTKSICTESLLYSVHALGQCFEHNDMKFVTKERFEMLVTPLVNCLEFCKNSEIDFDEFLPALVYCLGQLAVTVNNQLMWKPLQNQVLMQTRSEVAKIRFSALKVLQEFYNQLGELFLPMLPESIPFIAELIEDPDENVEELCQEVIAQLDEFLGDERIEDYL